MSTLTYADLEAMVDRVNAVAGTRSDECYPNPYRMHSLFGMPIIEAPRRPKMQLSEDCPVTDDFRKEMNAWLIEFFGYESIIPENTAYLIAGSHFVMRPEMVVKLSNICA